MSKTLRSLADDSDAERNISFDADNPVLDFHIIPGADAVVTPAGLEDAKTAVGVELGRVMDMVASEVVFDRDVESLENKCARIARAAIEAAGIEVADEGPLRVQEYPESQAVLVDGGLVELWTGDRLFIQRAATGKEE